MKIGIMTFWESHNNYGQLLQAFALQAYLKKEGHEVFFIKFHRIAPPKRQPLLKQLIKSVIRKIQGDSTSLDHSRGFDDFRKEHLTFSENGYKNYQELLDNPPIADAYVCGSDQVWNNTFKVPCEPFLLGFGPKLTKRVSYAASIGQKEISAETAALFKKHLENFNGISVRENSGVQICQQLGFSETAWVPDPTLLFTKAEWSDYLGININTAVQKKSGIFVYTLANSVINDKQKFIDYSNQMKDVQVIHASANDDSSGTIYPTINEWVGYIRSSDYIITNSFHGMVFCIIFNKKFVILPNTGHALGMNERITSLLGRFNLEEHVMYEFSKEKMDRLFEKEIDWKTINSSIDSWREEGKDFLNKSLLN